MIRVLIETDEVVGVKLFKIKILSNLIRHTLHENVSGNRKEVQV